jgi:AcrR family transcriptional regulator
MSRWKPDAGRRLAKAALALFDEQGYEATTVAEIAASAGLTKRTFFRYFADKREVLFGGSEELERIWVEAVAAAPADASPLDAVEAGLDAVADMFAERHAFAQMRARVIAANPELQERELIKLERLAGAIAAALQARGVSDQAAALAAQTGVRVFHVAFDRWIAEDTPGDLGRLIDESLVELRELLAPTP